MSSTNKTSNYELSQFVGGDKPAWLADYNSDMSKIDAQMKLNADGVTTASGNATTANTNIGTMANLETTDKSSLVAALNEVNTATGTAQSTASGAAATATTAKNEADSLATYISLTQNGDVTPTISGGTVGNINAIRYALNANGTLGKIYGRYRFTVNTTGTVTVTLPVSGLSLASNISINSGCDYVSFNSDSSIYAINARDMSIDTSGNVTITFTGFPVGATVTLWLPPCLYFFTDFGDQPVTP